MTLRDLFRWAERFRLADDDEKANGKQLLAENGMTVIHYPHFTCMQTVSFISNLSKQIHSLHWHGEYYDVQDICYWLGEFGIVRRKERSFQCWSQYSGTKSTHMPCFQFHQLTLWTLPVVVVDQLPRHWLCHCCTELHRHGWLDLMELSGRTVWDGCQCWLSKHCALPNQSYWSVKLGMLLFLFSTTVYVMLSSQLRVTADQIWLPGWMIKLLAQVWLLSLFQLSFNFKW